MSNASKPVDFHRIKLAELTDTGGSDNNFVLEEPPTIPKLKREYKVTGTDAAGNRTEVTVPRNIADVEKAKAEAEPWIQKNDATLSLLIDSLPPLALHIVQNEVTAKAVWDALIQHYQNPTSLAVDALFNKMSSYKWREGMDEKMWCDDMERMFGKVVQMDPSRMTDAEFLRLINILMPQTETWRSFANNVRKDMRDYEAQGKRMTAKGLLCTHCPRA